MGDLECEFQKNCVVETPWKFKAKMTLFGPISTSERSSADSSQFFMAFSGFPKGVLKDHQEKCWKFSLNCDLENTLKCAKLTIFKKSLFP